MSSVRSKICVQSADLPVVNRASNRMRQQSGFVRKNFAFARKNFREVSADKNFGGFTAIEALLILIIVGILGGTGWYVWNARNNATDTLTNADAANSSIVTKKNASLASWQTFKSPDTLFSIKAPNNWVSVSCENSGGSKRVLYMASSPNYLAKCQSDFTGEVIISSSTDTGEAVPIKNANDQDFMSKKVTVNGKAGYKVTRTTSKDAAIGSNTKSISYIFISDTVKEKLKWTATYQQIENAPNESNLFDQIVQTWSF